MSTIKRNVTKYSGLPLSALIHLAQTSAPVNELLRREVWKELFHRYFMEGRMFNLYELLHRNPKMFANTIGWELQKEDVAIPVQHAEDFIKNLLGFIDYIDAQVLKSGVEFEWQLHELMGMKSMIERVRDAKVEDINVRQKINVFIDKMNDARKKSLILIEQAKQEPSQQQSTSSNELVILQGKNEVVITEQKHELMKQELKRLSIPVSKLTRPKWADALENIDMYYPEDQEKLIRHGLKKFDFYDHKHIALRAFKLNLELKVPNASMVALLDYAMRYSGQIEPLFGTEEEFFRVVKDWYLSADKATEEGWNRFSTYLLQKMHGEFSKKKLIDRTINLMEELYPIVNRYNGEKLSDALKKTVVARPLPKSYENDVKFDKDAGLWVAHENKPKTLIISIFEQIYWMFDYIRGYRDGVDIVEYRKDLHVNTDIEISKYVPYQHHQMVRDFCHFIPSLVIDKGVHPLLRSQAVERLLKGDFLFDKSYLLQYLRFKFNDESVTDDELSFLFKTREGQTVFLAFTDRMFSSEGWLKSRGDFICKFFDRTLNLFDFSLEEDRNAFFRLPVSLSEFYKGYGYPKKEHVRWVAEKLREQAPHEYLLISEYFSNINESYEDYKVHGMFEYLSDFERLLLEREGIKTGGTIRHQGYKERTSAGEVYYTPEEAEDRFVFEYFQKLSQGEND